VLLGGTDFKMGLFSFIANIMIIVILFSIGISIYTEMDELEEDCKDRGWDTVAWDSFISLNDYRCEKEIPSVTGLGKDKIKSWWLKE